MGLFGLFGGDTDEQYDQYMGELQQLMGGSGVGSSLQDFLGTYEQMVGGIGLPELPEDVLNSLMQQYGLGMQNLQQTIDYDREQALSNLASRTATQGIMGSSAHGTAVGGIQRAATDMLSRGSVDLERQRMSDMMNLRNMMMQQQTQRYGIYGGMMPGLYGAQIGGYGQLGQLLGGKAQAQKSIFDMLGGLGRGAYTLWNRGGNEGGPS